LQLGKIAKHRFASAITLNDHRACDGNVRSNQKVLPFAYQASALAVSKETPPPQMDTYQNLTFQTPPADLPRHVVKQRGRRPSEQCVDFLPKPTQRRKKLDRFSISHEPDRICSSPPHDDFILSRAMLPGKGWEHFSLVSRHKTNHRNLMRMRESRHA